MTSEREPLRWGVIPLVDGHELLRAEGPSRDGRPMTIEYQLMRDEQGLPDVWRHELQVEGEEDPLRSTHRVLDAILRSMPAEQQKWVVRQEVQALDELAGIIRDLLLAGIYGKADAAMRRFRAHLHRLEEIDDEYVDAHTHAEELLNREPRTVPLDDLSHSVVCLAQTETPDGMVLVNGLRAEDNSGVPMVTVRDSETHADPFTIRLVTPEMADALWAAVYGARVVVWGEPTPFVGRS